MIKRVNFKNQKKGVLSFFQPAFKSEEKKRDHSEFIKIDSLIEASDMFKNKKKKKN